MVSHRLVARALIWGLGALAWLVPLQSLAGDAGTASAPRPVGSISASPSAWPTIPGSRVGGTVHPDPSLLFIENVGQFAPDVRYQVRGTDGRGLYLTDSALWFTLLQRPAGDAKTKTVRGVNLKLSFVGASAQTHLEPVDRQASHFSYFIGNDPAAWHPDVPVWGAVRYRGLYPGIDLDISGGHGGLQMRLVGQPSADLGAVRLRVEGSDAVALERRGPPTPAGTVDALRLTTAVGSLRLPLLTVEGLTAQQPRVKPLGTQTFDIEAPFAVATPQTVSGTAAASVLLYLTYLGGSADLVYSGYDEGHAIAVDGAGNAYVTGQTDSANFPHSTGAFQTTIGLGTHNNAFMTEFDPNGVPLYSSFLGGTSSDKGNGIAVDAAGNAYVTGVTTSADFPTTPGAYKTSLASLAFNAFVTKINPRLTGTASLVYSTFLGGNNTDFGYGIAVDTGGNAYVTGQTSGGYPVTQGAFQTTFGGAPNDAFVTKMNPTGSDLVYSTYIGGGAQLPGQSGDDQGHAIAVDPAGNAYITGFTPSPNFPVKNPFQTYASAFVTELNTMGSGLVYSSWLGGLGANAGCGIAVDAAGSA